MRPVLRPRVLSSTPGPLTAQRRTQSSHRGQSRTQPDHRHADHLKEVAGRPWYAASPGGTIGAAEDLVEEPGVIAGTKDVEDDSVHDAECA